MPLKQYKCHGSVVSASYFSQALLSVVDLLLVMQLSESVVF